MSGAFRPAIGEEIEMGLGITLKKFLAVGTAAATVLASGPGVARTLSDFERQFTSASADSYAGAF